MKSTWLVAAAVAAGLSVHAQECRPGVMMLTVYTVNDGGTVPKDVLRRARNMATKVLRGAGVTAEWADGERTKDPRFTTCGEMLTIAFDAQASANFPTPALAYTNLSRGSSANIHIFYDRVALFHDRPRMPEFLGHVLAHEIAHVLQGVARHSSKGVMKAQWSILDCADMAGLPLAFAREDVELIRAHFGRKTM